LHGDNLLLLVFQPSPRWLVQVAISSAIKSHQYRLSAQFSLAIPPANWREEFAGIKVEAKGRKAGQNVPSSDSKFCERSRLQK
jgi:hypothetical protein